MMAAPRAASVGATMAPTLAATHSETPGMSPKAAAVPNPMVRGSPMASSRTGRPTSWRSSWTLTREASVKSTRARVTSASDRIVDEWGLKWMKASGPVGDDEAHDHKGDGGADVKPLQPAEHQRPEDDAAGDDGQDPVSRPWFTGAPAGPGAVASCSPPSPADQPPLDPPPCYWRAMETRQRSSGETRWSASSPFRPRSGPSRPDAGEPVSNRRRTRRSPRPGVAADVGRLVVRRRPVGVVRSRRPAPTCSPSTYRGRCAPLPRPPPS